MARARIVRDGPLGLPPECVDAVGVRLQRTHGAPQPVSAWQCRGDARGCTKGSSSAPEVWCRPSSGLGWMRWPAVGACCTDGRWRWLRRSRTGWPAAVQRALGAHIAPLPSNVATNSAGERSMKRGEVSTPRTCSRSDSHSTRAEVWLQCAPCV